MKDLREKDTASPGKARARHCRLRAIRFVLALVFPVSLIAVVGCSTVRSCGASPASCGARPTVTLAEPAPARMQGIPAEGSFSGALGGDISGRSVVLRGRVAMYGNAPHAAAGFALEDGSRTYALYPDSREREARALQGHLIDLTATLLEGGSRGAASFSGDALCPLSWKIVN